MGPWCPRRPRSPDWTVVRYDAAGHGGLHRLGVHLDGDGVDVAVLASHATAVELCLLDPDQDSPDGWTERRVPLGGPTYGVWHAHVPGVLPGQRYGFRAHGAWDPGAGTRYNAAKLLIDPYARGLDGLDRLDLPSVHAYGQEVDEHHPPVGGRRPDCGGDKAVVGRTLWPGRLHPASVISAGRKAKARPCPEVRLPPFDRNDRMEQNIYSASSSCTEQTLVLSTSHCKLRMPLWGYNCVVRAR